MIPCRRPLTLAAILLALGLAACTPAKPGATSAAAPEAATPAPRDPVGGSRLSAPRNLPVAGPYRHEGTGLIYPVSSGDLARDRVVQFDSAADDVGANYEAKLGRGYLVATVYVYPWTDSSGGLVTGTAADSAACTDAFQEVKRATFMGLEMKGAEIGDIRDIRADGPVTAIFPDAKGAARMVFDMSQNGDAYQSEIHLHCGIGGAWLVKYRISYPKGAEVADMIAAFLQQVPER